MFKSAKSKKAIRLSWRVLRKYLVIAGIFTNVLLFWMAMGWPIFFDKLLILSETPMNSEYIVCLTGGVTKGKLLPSEEGWQRIYTAVQLYLDGYGPKIVFTGGGIENVAEAEIYAEAAQWLGCPENGIIIEPLASNTADHPQKLLKMSGLDISRKTPLNIITSPLHSRRSFLCFKKTGYQNFRIVTNYSSLKAGELKTNRSLRSSAFKEYAPSRKKLRVIFENITGRLNYFFSAAGEVTAIVVYKMQGLI